MNFCLVRKWREWIWEKKKKKNKITIEEKYKTQEIKPCPFCGGEAKCYNLSTNNDPAHYTITCTECWASIPAGDSEEETTNRWNRRTGQ